jgi:hypothetical protein
VNAILVLADNNFGDTMSGGLAGPTGLVVILLLVVGTIFLIRNMNARLRRLPDHFGDDPPTESGEPGSMADESTRPEEKAS